MKNFNKKFVVAIMLLVILFANNLSVQAVEAENTPDAQEIYDVIINNYVIYDVGTVQGEYGLDFKSPLLVFKNDEIKAYIKETYGKSVKVELEDRGMVITINKEKTCYSFKPSISDANAILAYGHVRNEEQEVIYDYGSGQYSVYYMLDSDQYTDIYNTDQSLTWKVKANTSFGEFSDDESGVKTLTPPTSSTETYDPNSGNTIKKENLADNRLFFTVDNGEGAYEAYITIDGVDYYPQVYSANGTPLNMDAYSDMYGGDVYRNGAFIGFANTQYYIIVTDEQLASGAAFYRNRVGDNYGAVSDSANKDGMSQNPISDEGPEFFEKVFAFFVRLTGEILYKLIGALAGDGGISIDKLVFDNYKKAQLTFFTQDLRFYDNECNPLIKDSLSTLSKIFEFFRKISLIVYMIILVYLGIRVLLFSTGDRQAKYKQVLVDWVKGILILFLFPYVIRYTINLNHAMVSYLETKTEETNLFGDSVSAEIPSQNGTIADSNVNTEIKSSNGSYMDAMYQKAKEGWLAPAICWIIMLIQIISFLIVYWKRLITVMFLIAIFPLVSISYALDKVADGKSQAFNNWCKEFVLQVFIQSFHAINYVLVMGIVGKLAPSDWLLQIIGITYITKGGDVIKNMFAQIRGTKGGGPLELAKSMLKTKVAINSVKSLKNFASSTFGANSVFGRGLKRLDLARTEFAEGRATAARSMRNKAIESSGYMFNPDGSAARSLTDDEARTYMNDLLHNGASLTDDEVKKRADALSRMAQTDLDRVAASMALTNDEEKNLQELLGVAAAAQIVSGPKAGKVNADVKTSAEILINVKEKVTAGTAEEIVKKYANANGAIPSESRLKGMAAANSIVFDEDSANAHRQARASAPQNLDDKTKVKNAMSLLKDASNGVGLMECHEAMEIVNDALANGDPDLEAIIRDESKDMSFSLEDLELNLYAQTVNISNSAEVYNNPEARKLVDKSIRKLKEARSNLASKTAEEKVVQGRILAGINADIYSLKEGEIPVLIDREVQRNRALQKKLDVELSKKQSEFKNDYNIDLETDAFLYKGQEYNDYLDNKAEEYKRMAAYDYVAGGLETVVGAAVGGKMVAYGTALSGVMVGASAEGKNDLFSDVIKNIPAGYGVVSSVAKEATGIASIPLSAVDNRLKGNRVSLANNKKSVTINEKYYSDQAKGNALNSEISQAEATRKALEQRLNRMNNGRNP